MRTIPFERRRRRAALLPLALLLVGCCAVAAPDAGATVRVASHNDPAGDATPMTYRFDSPTWAREPIEFVLRDGETTSYGPGPGTYTVQAIPPPGWQVNDIQCVGPDPAGFLIDVPNGVVTMTHGEDAEQTCSFTNGRVNALGPPSSGVAPSPPADELAKVAVPKEIALLGVRPGKGFVTARLRIIRRSIVKAQLRRGHDVLARKRVVRRAGTRLVRISLPREKIRSLRNRGRKRLAVTLELRVSERRGPTKVFAYRVIIPL
jgi:hypothetical protein